MFDNLSDHDHLRASVERITRKWFTNRDPWTGINPERLAQTRLPKPLRWLYGFAGEWPNSNSWESVFAYQDMLIPFELLWPHEGKLVFVSENQGVWQAGTMQHGTDPPVWVRENKVDSPWQPLCDSLTEFLVTFCLHEMSFGARYRVHVEDALNQFDRLDCHIAPLWTGPYVSLWDGETCRPRKFHLVNGDVLVMDNCWCSTGSESPWLKYPNLFQDPEEREEPDGDLEPQPFPEHIQIPPFIRKQHLQGLINRHECRVDYHRAKIANYERMMDAIDDPSAQ